MKVTSKRHFLMVKSTVANWPSGGSPFRLSNLKCFENIFVRGVRIILFVMKKRLSTERGETLQVRKSKWTFPESKFFIKKCRHDINKLKFNRNTKFSNLSYRGHSSGRQRRRSCSLAGRPLPKRIH